MGQYPNPPQVKKKISYPFKTRLLNLNLVLLGARRVSEKTRPVAIPNYYIVSLQTSLNFSYRKSLAFLSILTRVACR